MPRKTAYRPAELDLLVAEPRKLGNPLKKPLPFYLPDGKWKTIRC